jgi:hypothetical protein
MFWPCRNEDTDIAEELKSQVSNVKRIHTTRDGNRVPTNSFIVTFSTPILPSSIRVGYLNVRSVVYIPKLMQCYKCFKFGHHESKYVRQTICRRCSSNHDKNETCNVPVKFAGEHYATSRSCPVCLKEKNSSSEAYAKYFLSRCTKVCWITRTKTTFVFSCSYKVC